MEGPDGTFLCKVSERKFNWYLKKELATIVSDDPPTIRLHFEPNGPGHAGDEYYSQEFQNRCVNCGSDENLSRHHIVPHCFRKHFPEELKRHSYHDIVPLCLGCHSEYEDEHALVLRRELSEKYDVPLGGVGRYVDKEILKIRAYASTLLQHQNRIPQDRQDDMLLAIMEVTGYEEIDHTTLEEISSLEYLIEDNDSMLFGEAIVEAMSVRSLILLWRRHFIDSMKPRFMPDHWDLEREGR